MKIIREDGLSLGPNEIFLSLVSLLSTGPSLFSVFPLSVATCIFNKLVRGRRAWTEERRAHPCCLQWTITFEICSSNTHEKISTPGNCSSLCQAKKKLDHLESQLTIEIELNSTPRYETFRFVLPTWKSITTLHVFLFAPFPPSHPQKFNLFTTFDSFEFF